jgi:tRNA dimethylallyltransferase
MENSFSPDVLSRPECTKGIAILLAGATAVGKSSVAVHLAGRVGGEIISVDSMQVYAGLDIGTAKPSVEDRHRVRHHLIDVVALDESFDAAQFVDLAKQAALDIVARGRVPIFCGGTGLYFKAFLAGLGDSPPSAPALRGELEAMPLPQLLSELERRDPGALKLIDERNPRRVIRALEILRLSARGLAEQRAAWSQTSAANIRKGHLYVHGLCIRAFGLSRAREDLCQRIDRRVDAMFSQGLVEETKGLLKAGLARNRTALQAIGYRQVVEHLEEQRSLAETMDLVKVRTRQFAKRQLTWFRHQMPLDWLDLAPDADCETTVQRLLNLCASPPTCYSDTN